MSRLRVYDLLFDDENAAELGRHGVRAEEVLEILANGPILKRNRKGRRGAYLMIGLTDGGSCVSIPIEPTHDPEVWRPITAWPCKGSEAASLATIRGGGSVP